MPTTQISPLEEDALTILGDAIPVFARAQEKKVESETLEGMLNLAIQIMLPEGIRALGSVSLSRLKNPDRYHADIVFSPNPQVRLVEIYAHAPIGIVDLKRKTYAMNPTMSHLNDAFETLYPVTEILLQQLGLRKSDVYSRGVR